MAHRRGNALLVAPVLVLSLFLAGCPKRPATTAASAAATEHSSSAKPITRAPSPREPPRSSQQPQSRCAEPASRPS